MRIVLSIPGTSYIGLEVPNPNRQTVRLKEILKSEAYEKSKSALTLCIGKNIAYKACDSVKFAKSSANSFNRILPISL